MTSSVSLDHVFDRFSALCLGEACDCIADIFCGVYDFDRFKSEYSILVNFQIFASILRSSFSPRRSSRLRVLLNISPPCVKKRKSAYSRSSSGRGLTYRLSAGMHVAHISSQSSDELLFRAMRTFPEEIKNLRKMQ